MNRSPSAVVFRTTHGLTRLSTKCAAICLQLVAALALAACGGGGGGGGGLGTEPPQPQPAPPSVQILEPSEGELRNESDVRFTIAWTNADVDPASLQVVVGGALVFAAGVLITGSGLS